MRANFGGALEARGISASSNCLETKVSGEVEKEGGVLVLKRIHVKYRLKGSVDFEEVANRVHAVHRDNCPVYKSISNCIEITTELKFVTG